MAVPPLDLDQAHRWFAVECNNQAWDLIETTDRTPEQNEEMVHLAHAARHHWKQVGELINLLRADVLLSTAYGKIPRSEPALHYAFAAEQSSNGLEEVATFDRATIHGALAMAHRISGNSELEQESHRQMMACVEELSGEGESELIHSLYSN